MVPRNRLDPNTLPDSTAGSVEDVVWLERLLADGNHIVATVSGIVRKDEPVNEMSIFETLRLLLEISQFVVAVRLEVLGHIEREAEVASTMETGLVAIDKNGGLVVDGSKVQQDVVLPARRHFECG